MKASKKNTGPIEQADDGLGDVKGAAVPIKKMTPAGLVKLPVKERPKIRLRVPVDMETTNVNGHTYIVTIPRNQLFEIVDEMVSGAEIDVIKNKILAGALERLLDARIRGVRVRDIVEIVEENI